MFLHTVPGCIGLLSQTISYPLHETVCAIVAGVQTTSVFCSVWFLVIIAWLRWYVITKSIRGHQGIHTPKNITIVVVVTWIGSIASMIIPPVLGVGTLGYSEYYSTCSLTDTNPLEIYYVLFQGIVIAIALMLTLTFYTLIWCHILRHNKQFRDKFGVDNDTSSSPGQLARQRQTFSVSTDSRPSMIKAINKREMAITKNLFTVVCVFMLCYLAGSVNFLIPGSSVVTLYGVMILLANSVVNPIIYGLKHPNFQKVFKNILCCRRVG